MQLSSDQISQIKAFIHSRGFNYIEVETEILDHVASAVEEKLEKNPEISLEKAIHSVHQSFGVMGFSIFEDELQVSLSKRIRSMFKKLLWLQISTTKVFRVLVVSSVLFFLSNILLDSLSPDLFKVFGFTLLTIISASPSIYYRRVFKVWRKKSMIMGALLWPFIFSSFYLVYLIQVMPTEMINTEHSTMQVLLGVTTLIITTTTLASIELVQKVYQWTHEKWLKYHY